MRIAMSFLFIAALFAAGTPAYAEDVFLEAESSSSHSYTEVAEFADIVSGHKILRLWDEEEAPDEGFVARFPFAIEKDQQYHIWMAASVPGITSNFWWRLDDDEWNHVRWDNLQDFVEGYGVSGVMGWMRLDSRPLSKGDHVLTIRINERRSSFEQAHIHYLDAILITSRLVYPRGLVTADDIPDLQPRVVPPTPVKRAGKPGPPQARGSSVKPGVGSEILRSLGFDLLQTDSDHLDTNETSPGEWDWTEADAGLAECRRVGAKWQYFAHHHWPPEWYRNSSKFVPTTGVRSGRKLACMSIWSPDANDWFDHCYAALAEKYGADNKAIAAIYLGIHGDFGETLFPMGWHPLERERFGEEGVGAPDFWCGDPYARFDFRRFAEKKYGSLDSINSAWGTRFESLRKIGYPLVVYGRSTDTLSTPQVRRYWLDFSEWFHNSMTRFSTDISRIARKHFPDTLLLLPIGGGEEAVVYAQDNTALVKMSRDFDLHVRSTHGGYLPFPNNSISPLKRLATAARFYGVPYWTEAPGPTSKKVMVSRFMENICASAYGFWDWSAGPISVPDTFGEYANFITREKPVVDVALFFPTTNHRLHPEIGYPKRLSRMGADLRDVMDYDVVDELLINDGILKNYRVMFWLEGEFIEATTLAAIAKWVEAGGLLVKLDTRLQTVEGPTSLAYDLLGLASGASVQSAPANARIDIKNSKFLRRVSGSADATADTTAVNLSPKSVVLAAVEDMPAAWAIRRGKGWTVVWAGAEEQSQAERTFYELARDVVYNISSFDNKMRDAREVDTAWNGVYAVLLPSGEAILHNFNDISVEKTVAGQTLSLPPKSLRSVMTR